MTASATAIRINVDPTNPGQFFACCGLLELADRLWPGAEGWFADKEFVIHAGGGMTNLLAALSSTPLDQLDAADDMTSPLGLPTPFNLRLDWWQDTRSGGSSFKTWAGQQKVVSIARAMHGAISRAAGLGKDLLEFTEVIPDPDEPKKVVAPFYFDARRAGGAHNLDIGFSPDAQKIETTSYPVVELLCLIGLQRFRPAANEDRTFSYFAWTQPQPANLAAAISAGGLETPDATAYSFRLLYRTKYLKGFLPATPSRGAQ